MTDTDTRYECDACGFAVPLADLIPHDREHWCRCCIDRESTGRSTHRRDGNKLAKGSTVFEDWPGSGE